ncbi:guanine deaminase [Azospirillum sp. ST 5-10]|uniref:guanine deaminase n=1 Tax=unclassified Azospirillum TaxID=2630922 RepID=UPI003F49D62C
MADPAVHALRGRLLSFTAAPAGPGDAASHRFVEDGMVLVEGGRIAAVGPAAELAARLPAGAAVDHHPDGLIVPGFIDTHIHFPQTQVIASYGAQLLDWLATYTFPEEQKYADPAHAAANARFFVDELLRNGTTTAVAYGSVHPQSVEALFTEAEARGMGLVAGKVMMDRNAPAALTDTAETGYTESRALIERWHGRGRQRYAVTPRFAITSTAAQLEAAGTLLKEFPGVYLQSHLSENTDEIAAVRALFPAAASYTDVYDRFGLLGPRSLFGHCIHLDEAELRRLSESGSVAVFCPTSNLFIGSGLFDLERTLRAERPVRVALATDVGGGTSYSMLRTAAEAYKVLQMRGQNLPALAAFDRMTRGNAAALGLEDEIGRLEPGRWADLVVLDSRATPAMAHRMETVRGDLEEELFVLMTLGDDRAVRATYLQGRRVHRRDA